MAWLQQLDVSLFQFIYLTLRNPVFDVVMPFLSGNRLFYPALVILAVWLLWKGGTRGRIFVCLLALIVLAGDHFVVNSLKHVIGRVRPLEAMPALRQSVPSVPLVPSVPSAPKPPTLLETDPAFPVTTPARTTGNSMPSSHTSKWFAATLIAYVLYPRSWRYLLPLALGVGFSRIYVGAHYPSDVLVGAIVGAGYAAAGLVGLNAFWQWSGRRWFRLWWGRVPSLLNPDATGDPTEGGTVALAPALGEQQWVRLGYVLIAAVLVARLAVLASSLIELSKDEAYQWLWSKHLALSYYSKPPLIAYTQFLGTSLWGDTALGVRFFSPLIAAGLGFLLLRFTARFTTGRTAFCLVLVLLTAPLLAVGSVLMTIDPLLVLFWTLAMILGWRALEPDSTPLHWAGVGLAMGLAFLSKYSALYQLVCWTIFFALWPAARIHLRRPGPWLALLIVLVSTIPVLLWNAQHDWITLSHVAENAKLHEKWRPTLRYFWYFVGIESALLNPFYFVAAVGAMTAFRFRAGPQGAGFVRTSPDRQMLMVYLFCMGAPVFLGHWLYSLHSRVLPNWIAPAIAPMFCLMVLYWEARWRQGLHSVARWFQAAVVFGLFALAVLHEPRLVEKLTGRSLPPDKDPLRRVRGWKEAARVAGEARNRLLTEGKPVFIIANHYGITGQLSFYLPEARTTLREMPLVYSTLQKEPANQLYFWPEYRYREYRKGQNAIYVAELDTPRYPLKAWWNSLFTDGPPQQPEPAESRQLPEQIRNQFESVTDLGVHPVLYRRQVYHWVQLFECRNLR